MERKLLTLLMLSAFAFNVSAESLFDQFKNRLTGAPVEAPAHKGGKYRETLGGGTEWVSEEKLAEEAAQKAAKEAAQEAAQKAAEEALATESSSSVNTVDNQVASAETSAQAPFENTDAVQAADAVNETLAENTGAANSVETPANATPAENTDAANSVETPAENTGDVQEAKSSSVNTDADSITVVNETPAVNTVDASATESNLVVVAPVAPVAPVAQGKWYNRASNAVKSVVSSAKNGKYLGGNYANGLTKPVDKRIAAAHAVVAAAVVCGAGYGIYKLSSKAWNWFKSKSAAKQQSPEKKEAKMLEEAKRIGITENDCRQQSLKLMNFVYKQIGTESDTQMNTHYVRLIEQQIEQQQAK